MNTWVLADIHGEYENLTKVIDLITKNGFSLDNGDRLIQLGDRNDRGKDTYKVNEFFRELDIKYPGQVICIKGNHEDMMIDAARLTSDLMYYNGGRKTLESYSDVTHQYGRNSLLYSLNSTGHWDWTRNQNYYYEDENYFFSHAPIGKNDGVDFRTDPQILTWNYGGGALEKDWVHPDPCNGKLCVYGHIHGGYEAIESVPMYSPEGEFMYNRMEEVIKFPGVRRFGNAILLDTGSGCGGILSCLQLPDMVVYDSLGRIYKIGVKEEVNETKVD